MLDKNSNTIEETNIDDPSSIRFQKNFREICTMRGFPVLQ